MVLYDMQQALSTIGQGQFTRGAGIKPCGAAPPSLMVMEWGGGKVIKVTSRYMRDDGVTLLLPEISDLKPGDRLTITGRVGEGAPTIKEWGMCLRSPIGEFNQLAQALAPKDLFALSYVLDKADLLHPLFIHSNSWGNAVPDMDFFVDNISISRPQQYMNVMKDPRKIVYNMEADDFVTGHRAGDIFFIDPSSHVLPSGSPVCTIGRYGYSNAIHVGGRVNDWDGLDIRLDLLDLIPGNSYNINVTGKIESNAPSDAQIMLQVIPGYAWRDNHVITSFQEFNLSHTLTLTELETADTVRITTNQPGANVNFTIYNIEITT